MIYLNRDYRKMKTSKGEEGAITVFLSITLMIIITLTGMLVDGARIRTGEATMKRVASTALHSTLSHYDQTLKEDYGLFALAIPQGELEDFIGQYMEKGLIPRELSPTSTKYWDFYEFNIEKLQVSPRYSLAEDEVLRQQILEQMKYRGPQILVEEFYEKLQAMDTVGQTATLLKDKLAIERELNELAHLEKELEEAVMKARSFDPVADQQLGEVSFTESNSEEVSNSEVSSSEGNQEIWSRVNIIADGLKDQINANSKIPPLVKKIEDKLLEIKRMIDSQETTDSREETKAIKEELEKYRQAIENHNTGSLVTIAEGNQRILQEALITINQISSIVALRLEENFSQDEVSQINAKIATYKIKIRQYNKDLNYKKLQLQSETKGEATQGDQRQKAAKEAAELLGRKEGENVVIPKKLQEVLPSKGVQGTGGFSPIEFDYKPKKSGYSDESINLISTLLGGAEELGADIRDEIYINQYVLDTFNNYANQDKNSKIAFFNSEVEYILYGSPSQQENVSAIKRDLLMMRFVVNLLHVYRDPKLVESATILATTLAAAIGPAAMPLIKTLILCGYAMNYSIEDINQLLKGEVVNFYRSNPRLKLDYEDYLRFLMLRPGYTPSTKLNRVKDLIQLNLQENPIYGETYRLQQSSAFINLEVQYSMKVLFWGKKDRKVHYKMELTQGY